MHGHGSKAAEDCAHSKTLRDILPATTSARFWSARSPLPLWGSKAPASHLLHVPGVGFSRHQLVRRFVETPISSARSQ